MLAYCRYGPIDLLVHITDLPVDQRDLLAYLIAGETLKGSAGLPVGVQVGKEGPVTAGGWGAVLTIDIQMWRYSLTYS